MTITVDQMVEFLPRALEKVVLIQHAISTSRVDIDGDMATATTVCHELVRTSTGWKISKRAERNHFHNMPPNFSW